MQDPIEKDTPELKIEAADTQKTADKIMNGDTPDGGGKTTGQDKVAEPVKATEPIKPAEPVKAEEPKFELKLQEGSLLNASDVERTVSFAKEQGLTPKAAQALLDRDNQNKVSFVDSQLKEFNNLTVSWEKELEADKEFGGPEYKVNLEIAKRALDRFGSKRFKDDLSLGYGNNPGLVLFAFNVGKAMKDDSLVLPGSKSSSEPRDLKDVFYPSTEKKE